MRKVKINLAILAFLIGGIIAFAGTNKTEKAEMLFRFDQETETWHDITGQELGVDYECNNPKADYCSAVLENDDPESGKPIARIERGVYSPL
jgi:hypothetical protein